MKKGFAFAGVVAVLIVAGLLVLNITTPVSAQEVVNRSAAAQAALKESQGILHTRSEEYFNHAALVSEGKEGIPGIPKVERQIVETYLDLQTGKHRNVVFDAETGQVIAVFGRDGEYFYTSMMEKPGKIVEAQEPLVIYRIYLWQLLAAQGDEMAAASLRLEERFNQAREDPHVEYVGLETWNDGRRVHVLRFQPSPSVATLAVENLVSTIYFDAENYMPVEARETIWRNGEEILIAYHREIVSEVLPSSTPVAWDFSDLEGTAIADLP